MDLRNLRPLARPVDLHEQDLTRSEIEDLRIRLDAEATLAPVTIPPAFEPFDFQRRMTLPAIWFRWADTTPPTYDFDLALEALRDHLADHVGNFAFTRSDWSVQELTRFEPTRITGPALNIRRRAMILTDVDIVRTFRYDATCTPAACAALDGFDPSAMLAPYRDRALLDRAVQSAILIDRNVDQDMLTPTSCVMTA